LIPDKEGAMPGIQYIEFIDMVCSEDTHCIPITKGILLGEDGKIV